VWLISLRILLKQYKGSDCYPNNHTILISVALLPKVLRYFKKDKTINSMGALIFENTSLSLIKPQWILKHSCIILKWLKNFATLDDPDCVVWRVTITKLGDFIDIRRRIFYWQLFRFIKSKSHHIYRVKNIPKLMVVLSPMLQSTITSLTHCVWFVPCKARLTENNNIFN